MRALSRRIQKKAEWVFWAVISRADWNGQEVITVIVRVSVCMYVFLSTPVGWAQFNLGTFATGSRIQPVLARVCAERWAEPRWAAERTADDCRV